MHIAQPSAIKLSDRIRVFATRYNGSLWQDIAFWDSFDGGATFGSATAVITAASIGATYGLVDATVYYASGDARPYKMIFGIRQSSSVPSGLTLADSADGTAWSVVGTVFTAGADSWQAAGIVPSYVFKRSDGKWVVTLNTYDTSLNAYAAIAVADSPSGPFGAATLIASPYTAHQGTLTATKGAVTGTTTISGLRLGEPYLVWKSGQQSAEILKPIAQSGTTVTFDQALRDDYSGAVFAHVAARTIDPSILWQKSDGTWEGIFTAYKALSVLCEYTIKMTAPALTGPWTPNQNGIVFSPFGPGNHHINSTENPTPIIDTLAA